MYGQVEEAIAAMHRVQQLDPHSPALNVSLGNMMAFARRYDEAADFYQEALRQVPEHTDAFRGLGLVNLLRGRAEEVWRMVATESFAERPATIVLLRAMACACTDDETGARQALAVGRELPADAYLRSIYVAAVYAALGARNEAFD